MAGVRTQLLDGVFERAALAGLAGADEPLATPVVALPADPSSGSILETFGAAYAALVGSSEPAGAVAAGEAINPVTAEELVLAVAARASGRFASLEALLERAAGEAGGRRGAELRRGVVLPFRAGLRRGGGCAGGDGGEHRRSGPRGRDGLGRSGRSLRDRRVGVLRWRRGRSRRRPRRGRPGHGVDELVALDTELRAVLPVWGPTVDGILCAAAAADAANYADFLERLALDRE